jgi:hypothetical protein
MFFRPFALRPSCFLTRATNLFFSYRDAFRPLTVSPTDHVQIHIDQALDEVTVCFNSRCMVAILPKSAFAFLPPVVFLTGSSRNELHGSRNDLPLSTVKHQKMDVIASGYICPLSYPKSHSKPTIEQCFVILCRKFKHLPWFDPIRDSHDPIRTFAFASHTHSFDIRHLRIRHPTIRIGTKSRHLGRGGKRLRSRFMTIAVMCMGLVPIMWSTGAGSASCHSGYR